MTPKEKAVQLFNKFCYAIGTGRTDSGYYTNIIYAKQCALIAVDEILSLLFLSQAEINYWQQVKTELSNL